MGETKEKAMVRHHNEATRTKATHMFLADKKTVTEISRELEIPISTVSAWFQALPKRGHKRPPSQPPKLSREQYMERYFRALKIAEQCLVLAQSAKSVSDDASSDDEDDEA